jgi:hypothetical protein
VKRVHILATISNPAFGVYASHISLQGIFDSPCGMLIPLAAQVARQVSNTQANNAFSQCLLLPQIIASTTLPTPFKKKNRPMRISPSLRRIGWNAYTWNRPIRLKAPRMPTDRAITIGTPYLERPCLKGRAASDVQGDAKALCHVSVLFKWLSRRLSCFGRGMTSTKSLTTNLLSIMARIKLDSFCNVGRVADLSR